MWVIPTVVKHSPWPNETYVACLVVPSGVVSISYYDYDVGGSCGRSLQAPVVLAACIM